MIRRLATLALLACLATPCLGAELTVVTTAPYPEGPLWFDGRLLYVEYAGHAVMSWDGTAAKPFWDQPGCGASGLAPYGPHHVLVACYDSNSLVELDAQGRPVRRWDRDSAGRPFTGPNDFAVDAHGGVYVSASGVYDTAAPITGAVLYLSADGQTLREVANTIHYPNGLTMSHDGRALLVAEMLAGRLLAFAVGSDGSLGARTVWARLQDLAPPTPHMDAYNGPDGIKTGDDGNYYITQNGSGRLLVVAEDRRLVRTIEVPTPYISNVGFGADGTHTLYITGTFDEFKAPYPGVVYRWRD